MRASCVLALGIMLVGCGKDDSDTAIGEAATCDTTAAIARDEKSNVVTATGTITCSGSAQLEIEVCLQMEGDDTTCVTAIDSATTLTDEAQVTCFGSHTFRARVTSTVDGVATETLSDELQADC